MLYDNGVMQVLVAKFRPFIARAKVGGIFTKITRERLLGIRAKAGRDRTENDFWYDVRNGVRNALVDLELFTQTADRSQVNQVLTQKTLEPVVTALLRGFAVSPQTEPDPNLAEIADMLIHWGFDYWQTKAGKNITLSHSRTIEEAVDLSRYLLRTTKEGSD